MTELRDVWEETSFRLENFQTNTECVKEEAASMKLRTVPPYKLSFAVCESHCVGNFPEISTFYISAI